MQYILQQTIGAGQALAPGHTPTEQSKFMTIQTVQAQSLGAELADDPEMRGRRREKMCTNGRGIRRGEGFAR